MQMCCYGWRMLNTENVREFALSEAIASVSTGFRATLCEGEMLEDGTIRLTWTGNMIIKLETGKRVARPAPSRVSVDGRAYLAGLAGRRMSGVFYWLDSKANISLSTKRKVNPMSKPLLEDRPINENDRRRRRDGANMLVAIHDDLSVVKRILETTDIEIETFSIQRVYASNEWDGIADLCPDVPEFDDMRHTDWNG